MALVELNLKAKPVNKYAAIMNEQMAMYVLNLAPVGSKYCVSPPPEDSDTDFLCLLSTKNMSSFQQEAVKDGWVDEGNEKGYEEEFFVSLRKESINLILTWDRYMYDMFVVAAELCKLLNLKDKTQRIAVHNAVMHGKLEGPAQKAKGPALGDGFGVNAAWHPKPVNPNKVQKLQQKVEAIVANQAAEFWQNNAVKQKLYIYDDVVDLNKLNAL